MFKKIVWLGFSTKWKKAKDVEKYISWLVEWWATEFFTGYNPDYWHEKFGFEVSPNWRFAEHEQITDFETLKQVVQEVHKYGFEVFINLNAWYYTNETFPLIEKMIAEFEEVWVDGIICWNIWVLEYLKSINYSKKINISTIMAVYNSESIRFFLENYKINKIILSREVTLKEIETLVTNFPDTLFEVFGEWDFCRYNNWLCFAEHKYWAKDICTVVVNDLVLKKRFRPDFKELVLNKELSIIDKLELLNDEYINIFDQINNILKEINTWFEINLEEKNNELLKIYKQNLSRTDLFYDALLWINTSKNKNILTFFAGLKYINSVFKEEKLLDLEKELKISIETWMKYFTEALKENWGIPGMNALKTKLFYSKWDNLNLFSYLFFDKFENIETVKFPTRWRNYNEKIKIIEEVLWSKKVDEKFLDRSISPERTHYDLSYIFGDKLWFRDKQYKNN